MVYLIACTNCHYQQFSDGVPICPHCGNNKWYNVQTNILWNVNRTCRHILRDWVSDGGCCGCNRTRRRISLSVLAFICIAAAIITYFLVDEDQKEQVSIPLGVIGGMFALGAICCPNKCCYDAREANDYDRV